MFPFVPMKRIIETQGAVGGYDLEHRLRASEEYLARQNIYFIRIGKHGVMPHEFKDPISEIPKMLHEVKQSLAMQGKGDELDIEANMRRFKRLFSRVVDKASEPPKIVGAATTATIVTLA